jgi:hypothetical protein
MISLSRAFFQDLRDNPIHWRLIAPACMWGMAPQQADIPRPSYGLPEGAIIDDYAANSMSY